LAAIGENSFSNQEMCRRLERVVGQNEVLLGALINVAIFPKHSSNLRCAPHRLDQTVFRATNNPSARINREGIAAVVDRWRKGAQVGYVTVLPDERMEDECEAAVEA
jgi:hypothetical protein